MIDHKVKPKLVVGTIVEVGGVHLSTSSKLGVGGECVLIRKTKAGVGVETSLDNALVIKGGLSTNSKANGSLKRQNAKFGLG